MRVIASEIRHFALVEADDAKSADVLDAFGAERTGWDVGGRLGVSKLCGGRSICAVRLRLRHAVVLILRQRCHTSTIKPD